jgi:hypothetical protein
MKTGGRYLSLLAIASCLVVATLFAGPAGADPGAAGNSVSSGNADALNGSTASGCALATGSSTASGDCPSPRPAVAVQPSITPGVTPPAARAATAATPVSAPSAALALTGAMSVQLATLAALLLLAGTSVVLLTRERATSTT